MRKLVCAMLLALSPFASAHDPYSSPLYLKFGFGSVDPDIQELDGYNTDQPSGYGITFGYQSSPFLALESSYIHLGELSKSYDYSSNYGEQGWDDYLVERAASVDLNRSWSTQAIGAVLTTNVYQGFSAGLRFGYHKWEEETDISESGTYTQYEMSSSSGSYEVYISEDYTSEYSYRTEGNDPYYGVTLGFGASNWVFSADYTVYRMEDTSPALGSLSVGLRF